MRNCDRSIILSLLICSKQTSRYLLDPGLVRQQVQLLNFQEKKSQIMRQNCLNWFKGMLETAVPNTFFNQAGVKNKLDEGQIVKSPKSCILCFLE